MREPRLDRRRDARERRSRRRDASRAERFFHPGPEAFRPTVGRCRRLQFAEPRQQLTFLFREAIRSPQLYTDVKVSGRSSVDPGQAASAQMEDMAALRPGGNLQCNV